MTHTLWKPDPSTFGTNQSFTPVFSNFSLLYPISPFHPSPILSSLLSPNFFSRLSSSGPSFLSTSYPYTLFRFGLNLLSCPLFSNSTP